MRLLVVVVALLYSVDADYECICNYNVEKEVYAEKSTVNLPLGYIYEFDCKEVFGNASESGAWVAIGFHHSVGYIEMDGQTELQTCPGEPSLEDKATTPMSSSAMPTTTTDGTTVTDSATAMPTTPASPSSTSTMASTTMPTTTTPVSTTQSTTTATASTTSSTASTATSTPSTTTVRDSTVMTTIIDSTVMTAVIDSTMTTPASTSGMMTTPTATYPSTSSTTQSSSTTTAAATTSEDPSTTYGCSDKYRQEAQYEGGVLFSYDRACYEIVPLSLVWESAEADCVKRGGHLAHITTAGQQAAIHNVLENYHGNHGVWIGLHDRNNEENFEWSSGEPVTYTNFQPGRKDPVTHTLEDCVGFGVSSNGYDGTWEDLRCGNHFHYICQFAAVPVTVSATTTPVPATGYSDGDVSKCPYKARNLASQYGTTLVQHGNSCYELLHNKVTWSHGESLCREADGHLAHIGSAEEQAYVQSFLERYNPDKAIWIGLHDINTENSFEWTNGAPVTYTNWLPNHLDNFVSHHDEDCIALIPYKAGVWDDIPCGDSLLGLDLGETHLSFCEYDIVSTASGSGVLVG